MQNPSDNTDDDPRERAGLDDEQGEHLATFVRLVVDDRLRELGILPPRRGRRKRSKGA